jgi:hypothetical protein
MVSDRLPVSVMDVCLAGGLWHQAGWVMAEALGGKL